jgi:hypothetical protein
MAHRQTAWFIALALLSGCESGGSPSTGAATALGAPAAAGVDGVPRAALAVNCFETRTQDGSVQSFHYSDLAGEVVGVLDYDFKEKDGAHGTFSGKRQDDLISAIWTRAIEGSTERQEVLIRLEPDRAVKANGELIAGADGVLRLKDRSAASFNEVFGRVQCD